MPAPKLSFLTSLPFRQALQLARTQSFTCTGAALRKRYIEVYPMAAAAVGRSWLRGVNPPSGGGRFLGGGYPPAAAAGPPKLRFLIFQQLAKRLTQLDHGWRVSATCRIVPSKIKTIQLCQSDT